MSKNNNQPGFLAAFFGFRRMVSPSFIAFFYYLGLIAILVGAGAALMGKGPMSDQMMQNGLGMTGTAGAVGYYVGVVLFAIFLILVLRFYSELLIVLFSIFNRLGDISNALSGQQPASPQPSLPVVAPAPAAAPAKAEDPVAPEHEDNGAETGTELADDTSGETKED